MRRHLQFVTRVSLRNVVGIVATVPINLSGIELAAPAVVGFNLISLAESITSAVRVAAAAVKRRDEARLDSRLGFAIVLCERLLARDPKKVSGAEATYATSKVPSALTREILPGYFLDLPRYLASTLVPTLMRPRDGLRERDRLRLRLLPRFLRMRRASTRVSRSPSS